MAEITGYTLDMETNSRYAEILELANLMDKLRIPYILRPCYDGWELLYPTIADVLIDAVSHTFVNKSRNLIEVMGPGECNPTIHRELTAEQAITHFYLHYRFNRGMVDRLLPPKSLKEIQSARGRAEFYDIETREYVTREQLHQEYKEAERADPRGLTFGQYIRSCLTVNNGTLMYV